jgi:hypothetical protein
VRIAPKVRPGLGPQSLRAVFDSVRGAITSEWALDPGATAFTLDVALPTGVQGAVVQVHKPFKGDAVCAKATVTEGGKVVWDGEKLVGSPDGISAGRDTAEGVAFDVINGVFSFMAACL